MRKKYYIRPAVEVCAADIEELLLIGSVTDVITPELEEEEELIPPGTDPDDLWGGAV